jgi:hypothetical protein
VRIIAPDWPVPARNSCLRSLGESSPNTPPLAGSGCAALPWSPLVWRIGPTCPQGAAHACAACSPTAVQPR